MSCVCYLPSAACYEFHAVCDVLVFQVFQSYFVLCGALCETCSVLCNMRHVLILVVQCTFCSALWFVCQMLGLMRYVCFEYVLMSCGFVCDMGLGAWGFSFA